MYSQIIHQKGLLLLLPLVVVFLLVKLFLIISYGYLKQVHNLFFKSLLIYSKSYMRNTVASTNKKAMFLVSNKINKVFYMLILAEIAAYIILFIVTETPA